MTRLVVLGLGAYILLDATAPRGVAYWWFAYASLFFVLSGIALAWLFYCGAILVERGTKWLVACWAVLGILYLFPVGLDPLIYWQYVGADFVAMVAFPLLFILLGSYDPALYSSSTAWNTLFVILLVGALIAPLTTDLWGSAYVRGIGGERYDPPPATLVAMAAVSAVSARSLGKKHLMMVLLVVLAVLAFLSQQRTGIVLWLIVTTATAVVVVPRGRLGIMAIVAAVTVGAAGWAASQPSARSALRSVVAQEMAATRFSELDQGADASLLRRAFEAQSVVANVSAGGPLVWFTGYGHGATFEPHFIGVVRTAEGRLHTVHIGLFLMLNRYGLIGVLLCLALLVALGRDLVRLRRRCVDGDAWSYRWELFLTIALVATWAEFMLRNVNNNPVVSYLLAGYLLLRPGLADSHGHVGDGVGADAFSSQVSRTGLRPRVQLR